MQVVLKVTEKPSYLLVYSKLNSRFTAKFNKMMYQFYFNEEREQPESDYAGHAIYHGFIYC
jgi:hypothetical protein